MTDCLFCDEPVTGEGVPVSTLSGPRTNHRECALREVLGGIGHQIAHEFWCTQMHDPDAGLTRHQSALMVAFMYELMGDDLITRSYASARDGGEVVPLEPPPISDDEWGAAVVRWADQEEPPEELPTWRSGWGPPDDPASESRAST